MFAPPPVIQAEVFARLPDALRIEGVHTDWSRGRGGGPLHSFLEGPAFDRAGNFYCTDLNHGRIFRVAPDGSRWDVFAEGLGGPNGLKIHRDGRIFAVDRRFGVIAFDPATGARSTILDRQGGRPFDGLNDLCFADNGDLYFTDPGRSSMRHPNGRVLRLATDGTVEVICDGLPYPNGLVLSGDQKTLHVALTRTLQVIRITLHPGAKGERHYPYGVFAQVTAGGLAGLDGMAVDEAGGLAVAHAGLATVWVFDRLGVPVARVTSPAGLRTTNVAYGGPDRRDLYVTESEDGAILRARLPTPGRPMFSHA
jgi:gluconolactonase